MFGVHRRLGRERPSSASTPEQPPQPPEDTTASGGGRCRPARGGRRRRRGGRRPGCGGVGCRVGRGGRRPCRIRRGRRGLRRFGTGRSFRRPGRSTRFGIQPDRPAHLLVVATQNGIRGNQASRLPHLLVVPAQNGICRNCTHDRLLAGSRAGHCNEYFIVRSSAFVSGRGRGVPADAGRMRVRASRTCIVAGAMSAPFPRREPVPKVAAGFSGRSSRVRPGPASDVRRARRARSGMS